MGSAKRLNLDDVELDPSITSDEIDPQPATSDERLVRDRPPHHEAH